MRNVLVCTEILTNLWLTFSVTEPKLLMAMSDINGPDHLKTKMSAAVPVFFFFNTDFFMQYTFN